MRKIILATFAVLLMGSTAFASLERSATAGLYKNEIDRVVNAVDILSVEKNLFDFAYNGWTGTATAWESVFGIITPLPIKIGGSINWSENNSGTPELDSSKTVLWEDLVGADGIVDNKLVTDIEFLNYTMLSTREFTVAVGITKSLGVSYTFEQGLNRTDGSYDATTGLINAAGNTYTRNYAIDGTLIDETAVISSPAGYADSSTYLHRGTLGLKLGSILDLWANVYHGNSGMEEFGLTTNSTYIPGANIEHPTVIVDTYRSSTKINTIGINPYARLWLTKSKPTLFFIDVSLDGSVGVQGGINGNGDLTSLITKHSVAKTIAGVNVATTTAYTTNEGHQNGYTTVPISLSVRPFLFKTYDKFKFAVGVFATAKFTSTGYTALSSNETITVYDDGDTEANDPNDYTSTTIGDIETSDYFNNRWDLDLMVLIGSQVKLGKITTLRFGTTLAFNYDTYTTGITYTDFTPTSTITTYGSGLIVETYGNMDTVTQTSDKDVFKTITTSVGFNFGMGFQFTPEVFLDTMFAIGASDGNVFNLENWSVELSYRFAGKAKASVAAPTTTTTEGEGNE